MNAIPLINNIPKTNINNEKQLRQEINTSLVALKKEAGTLEGLINEAAQMLVTINNRIATLENDTVKKSDIVDVVQSGNLQPVTSNAVAGVIASLEPQQKSLNIDTLYPSENGKIENYFGNFSGNVPESRNTATLKVIRVKMSNSSEVHLYQEWECYGASSTNYAPNQYFRYGYFTGSNTPTWTVWKKVITNSDLFPSDGYYYKNLNVGMDINKEAVVSLPITNLRVGMKFTGTSTNGGTMVQGMLSGYNEMIGGRFSGFIHGTTLKVNVEADSTNAKVIFTNTNSGGGYSLFIEICSTKDVSAITYTTRTATYTSNDNRMASI